MGGGGWGRGVGWMWGAYLGFGPCAILDSVAIFWGRVILIPIGVGVGVHKLVINFLTSLVNSQVKFRGLRQNIHYTVVHFVTHYVGQWRM